MPLSNVCEALRQAQRVECRGRAEGSSAVLHAAPLVPPCCHSLPVPINTQFVGSLPSFAALSTRTVGVVGSWVAPRAAWPPICPCRSLHKTRCARVCEQQREYSGGLPSAARLSCKRNRLPECLTLHPVGGFVALRWPHPVHHHCRRCRRKCCRQRRPASSPSARAMARLTVRCSTLHAARQQIATRARSATELTQAYLRGLRSVEPAVQSFIMVDEEGALEQAAEVDRRVAAGEHLPLAGVPIAIKVGHLHLFRAPSEALPCMFNACCLHHRNSGQLCRTAGRTTCAPKAYRQPRAASSYAATCRLMTLRLWHACGLQELCWLARPTWMRYGWVVPSCRCRQATIQAAACRRLRV